MRGCALPASGFAWMRCSGLLPAGGFAITTSPRMKVIPPVPLPILLKRTLERQSDCRPTRAAYSPAIPLSSSGSCFRPTTWYARTGTCSLQADFANLFRSQIGLTRLATACETSTPSGGAALCSRAAMFTASPTARYSTCYPSPNRPTTTVPV